MAVRAAAVILAAGESTRMRRVKATVRVGGQTLLDHAARPFVSIGARVVVVTGFFAEEVEPVCVAMGAVVARNVAPHRGMASSIRTGLRRVDEDVVFVHPVDCPGVKPVTLQFLLSVLAGFPDVHAAVPLYRGKGGHPVLLDRVARHLMVHRRDLTLRDLLAALGPGVVRVETDDPSVLLDIDTEADARAWISRFNLA